MASWNALTADILAYCDFLYKKQLMRLHPRHVTVHISHPLGTIFVLAFEFPQSCNRTFVAFLPDEESYSLLIRFQRQKKKLGHPAVELRSIWYVQVTLALHSTSIDEQGAQIWYCIAIRLYDMHGWHLTKRVNKELTVYDKELTTQWARTNDLEY